MMGQKEKGRLCVEDYTYPGEENAFAVLKKIPVLDQVIAAYQKYVAHALVLPQIQGDYFRITEDTCPAIYAVYQKALERLDIEEEYPLFSKSCFEYNAYTLGGNAPCVVIHSSLLKNLAEDELLFVLGHELGHVKSGHLVYYEMARQLTVLAANIPAGGGVIFSTGLHLALTEWRRMHEFTADRAGAVAAGNIDASIRALGKLLGTSEKIPFVKFETEDLIRQNDSFEECNQDVVSRLFCIFQIMNSSHPWTISRIKELERWGESGEFEKVKICGD